MNFSSGLRVDTLESKSHSKNMFMRRSMRELTITTPTGSNYNKLTSLHLKKLNHSRTKVRRLPRKESETKKTLTLSLCD